MAEKKIGHGTQLKQGSTVLSQIRNITPPAFSREEVPATTLDSDVEDTLPSDPPAVGEIQFEQIWTSGDNNHELLDTAAGSRSIDEYSIVLNGLTTVRTGTFSAWVKSIAPTQIDGKNCYARTVVMKLTTLVDWSS